MGQQAIVGEIAARPIALIIYLIFLSFSGIATGAATLASPLAGCSPHRQIPVHIPFHLIDPCGEIGFFSDPFHLFIFIRQVIVVHTLPACMKAPCTANPGGEAGTNTGKDSNGLVWGCAAHHQHGPTSDMLTEIETGAKTVCLNFHFWFNPKQ